MKAIKRILCMVLTVCTIFINTGVYANNESNTNHIIINQIYGGGEENDGKKEEEKSYYSKRENIIMQRKGQATGKYNFSVSLPQN